jgi:hypothetical protein
MNCSSIAYGLMSTCVMLGAPNAGAAPIDLLPPLVQAMANFGPGCNLALRIPRGAEFPISYSAKSGHGGSTVMLESLPVRQVGIGRLYLGMVCYDTRVANVIGNAPVRFDSQQDQWVRHLGAALLSWDAGDGLNSDEVFAIDQSIRVYPLNNVNSKGFVYTTDDWTGDETKRTRQLSYCLFRAHIGVCSGRVEVAALAYGPKVDVITPYVLQILRSIEFLPDEPPSPASAPSAQSSGPHH